VRIAQQGRNARDGSHHLCIERPTAVANQKVGLFTLYQIADESDSLLRVHRQVGRYHLRTPHKSPSQSHRRYALTTGIESMQEQDYFCFHLVKFLLKTSAKVQKKEK
jgi:hypothetical protein